MSTHTPWKHHSNMDAVILAGGKGTRLRPFTMTIPKPLLPLGDVPIVEIVIRQLAAGGFDRIILTLGHMAPLFSTLLGDGKRLGVDVQYCYEETPLGTAGPLRLIENLSDPFLVMNGDLLTTISFRDLILHHRTMGAVATIASSCREVYIDYGVVDANERGMLAGYREKPTLDYQVSMGINVLSREALDFIPADTRFDMPELMLTLMRAGHDVACYQTHCYWQDIGRFDDYQRASEDFTSDPARFLPIVLPVTAT